MLNLSDAAKRALLENPNLTLEELRALSDSELLELIQSQRDIVIHPRILGAIKSGENPLVAIALAPDFDSSHWNNVPRDVQRRIEALRKQHAANVFSSLRGLDGCAQAAARIGRDMRKQG